MEISARPSRRELGQHHFRATIATYPAKVLLDEYLGARWLATKETGIAFELFPEQCPFTVEEVLDVDFFPANLGMSQADELVGWINASMLH